MQIGSWKKKKKIFACCFFLFFCKNWIRSDRVLVSDRVATLMSPRYDIYCNIVRKKGAVGGC